MSDFPVQYRDLQFALFEHLKIQDFCGYDQDDIEAILEASRSFSEDFLAPANPILDREGVKRNEDGSVTTPDALKKAYAQFCEDGWSAMSAPEDFDGQELPVPVVAAIDEMLIGGCCAFSNYTGLSRACSNMLFKCGTEEQKQTWAVPMTTGEWQGTMCLTEAGAGSDVGASLTKATPIEGDKYKIAGTKVFITSGEHDMTENFVHIVLARIEGGPNGVKGLSIFIVPKYRFGDSGKADVYNDVFCSGIEEKMGIHGSVTTTLEFGREDKCEGYIIGEPGQGIRIMFEIMNEERIAVGQQGQALAAFAYGHALKYSQERLQGSSIRKGKTIGKEKVNILQHPDVRRMLMTCKAQTEALRALLLWTASLLHKSEDEELPKDERKAIGKLAALLTPICKSHGSEVGFQVCSQAMQVYGGYGYCQEFPAEQYLRDSRIACVYEGTNGIQAIDLLFRKCLGDKGATLTALDEHLGAFSAKLEGHDTLGDLKVDFDKARAVVGKVFMHIAGTTGKDLGLTALTATPFLALCGNLICAFLLLEQAHLADEKLKEMSVPKEKAEWEQFANDNVEGAFYLSKVETARFFVKQILPENRWRAAQIVDDDGGVLSSTAFYLA
ncbi:MAG: acyl-CoA dehydrogenase [Planctomycetota bacterium]|nr:acyl-CoA dehydrogenase [Planctomycetota bacterium]